MESEPMLTPREKSPLPEKFSPEEDWTHVLHQAGQRAQHTTNWAITAPKNQYSTMLLLPEPIVTQWRQVQHHLPHTIVWGRNSSVNNNNNNDFISIALFHVKHAQLRCTMPMNNTQLVVLGLAVHSVMGSILLWGHFPVEGIFPLELTWVQTPFPQKLFRMRV